MTIDLWGCGGLGPRLFHNSSFIFHLLPDERCAKKRGVEEEEKGASLQDGNEFEGMLEPEGFFQKGKRGGEDEGGAEEAQGRLVEEDEDQGNCRGGEDREGVFPTSKSAAETDDEGPLLRLPVGDFVAEVIRDEDRAGEKAGGKAGEEDGRVERERLEKIGSANGDGAEKHEDEEFAESEIADGLGAARVKDA